MGKGGELWASGSFYSFCTAHETECYIHSTFYSSKSELVFIFFKVVINVRHCKRKRGAFIMSVILYSESILPNTSVLIVEHQKFRFFLPLGGWFSFLNSQC